MESKRLTVNSSIGKVIVNELVDNGTRWWTVDDIGLLIGMDRTEMVNIIGSHMFKYENDKWYVDAFGLFKLNPILQDSVLDTSLTRVLLRKKSFNYKISDFRKIVGAIRSCRMEIENLEKDINLCDRANCDIYHDFENDDELDVDYFKRVLTFRRERKKILRLYEIMNEYFKDVDLEALEGEICKHKTNMDNKAYNRRLSDEDKKSLEAKIKNIYV